MTIQRKEKKEKKITFENDENSANLSCPLSAYRFQIQIYHDGRLIQNCESSDIHPAYCDGDFNFVSFLVAVLRRLAFGSSQRLGSLFLLLLLLLDLCQTLGISKIVHSDGQEDIQQDVWRLLGQGQIRNNRIFYFLSFFSIVLWYRYTIHCIKALSVNSLVKFALIHDMVTSKVLSLNSTCSRSSYSLGKQGMVLAGIKYCSAK